MLGNSMFFLNCLLASLLLLQKLSSREEAFDSVSAWLLCVLCSVEKVHGFLSNGVLPYSSDGRPLGCGHNMHSFGGL